MEMQTQSPSREIDLSEDPLHQTSLNGYRLTWRRVSLAVKGKQILDDIAGEVSSAQVCAILGPSGSGKTSLLNVLAGRMTSRPPNMKVSCHMEVDGVKTSPVAFRKNVAYVMQDDALIPTATPREALMFSAALRLPGMQADERKKKVEGMLKELDLEGCADVYIGGELVKGISGGQRKRTSVGVELVTHPGLVFLDEPTSGLDSEAALSCVKLLNRVAKHGATILCTIHQPSSEVFSLFERVILLKDGKAMYQGKREGIVDFFTNAGFEPPVHHNLADFMMSVASRTGNDELQSAGFFDQSDYVKKQASSPMPDLADEKEDAAIKSGFFFQLYLLLIREFQALVRNKAALIGRFGVTIFLNLLFGLIFEGAGGRDDADPENVSSHFGALTMIAISSMFGAAEPVMLSFPLERPVFLREYTTGTYSCLAYFISKALVELPLALLQSLVQYALVYPLIDFQGNFGMLVLSSWALGVASSSVAVVMGCSVADVRSVAELAPAVFVPQILFAGFFVRIQQIPSYLRWAQYLCALKYCLNLLLLTEFDDCGANSDTPSIARENCKEILDSNEIDRSDIPVYWGVLVALFFGFRTIASFVLVRKARNFY